jgi:hypothetical protein
MQKYPMATMMARMTGIFMDLTLYIAAACLFYRLRVYNNPEQFVTNLQLHAQAGPNFTGLVY